MLRKVYKHGFINKILKKFRKSNQVRELYRLNSLKETMFCVLNFKAGALLKRYFVSYASGNFVQREVLNENFSF